ncbi:MAG TPA: aldehyde dehydrogenase family protein [Oculatellaceae cyanobacterium]
MLKEMVRYSLGVKGAKASSVMEVKSPFGGEVLAEIELADAEAIDKALKISKDVFASTMRTMPAYRRSEILQRTSELLLQRKEELARTIASEGGKPIKDARIEVARAVNTFAIAAREVMHLDGEQLPMDVSAGNDHRFGIIVREPIGVIGAITPFNFPLNLVAHKVAPALAGGNTVVLKPSSATPIASFKLLEILTEAGLPEGVLQVVPCRGSQGNALVRDERVALISFTGSPEVGWRLRKEIHEGTRIALELGGNAALVVHDDADLELAAKAACRGGYAHSGQTCISVQRIYVQAKVYDEFLKIYKPMVVALKVGDPLDENTDMGPMIDADAVENTRQMVDQALGSGASLACGGKYNPKNCVDPIVLTGTTHDMTVVHKEVFGPVTAVMKYDTIDDAVKAVNDSRYGIQAGIFTKNLEVAFYAGRNMDVGGVIVNDAPTFRADHMPYGGRKESGAGLEGVKYAIHEMTQPKFICLNLPR